MARKAACGEAPTHFPRNRFRNPSPPNTVRPIRLLTSVIGSGERTCGVGGGVQQQQHCSGGGVCGWGGGGGGTSMCGVTLSGGKNASAGVETANDNRALSMANRSPSINEWRFMSDSFSMRSASFIERALRRVLSNRVRIGKQNRKDS
jgi:hypothetical protein